MSTSSEPKAIVKPKAIAKPKATVKKKPTIFREYIGVKPDLDNLPDFPDIINPNIPEFHFILGFAKEDYDTNGRGTGHFRPTWNADYFSPANIKKLKHKPEYQNVKVKVLISIGGVGLECPFNPAEIDEWLPNATASLKEIFHDYNVKNICNCDYLIDGIDINYEVITSNDIDFALCMGEVISALRNEGLIEMVSIAPSEEVQPHYRRLYEDHGRDIDWVNFKFYNQTVPSAENFINLYGDLSEVYPAAKLLAGFSTDPDFRDVTLEVFLEGCSYLLSTKSLAGIFVWNANDSAVSRKPFWLEYIAQILLINPPPN